MKSLALYCKQRGLSVSGSDIADCPVLRALAEQGIRAYVGHDPDFAATRSLAVYTAAIPSDDPELSAARAAKVLCMERKAFLALVASEFDKVAAVAGSHGKTTVTAMLCAILRSAGAKFVGHIGGDCIGGECDSTGGTELFVTEACEYNRTFLALRPDVALVLDIAFDHPDCYRDVDEMRDAFRAFCSNIADGGVLIVDNADADLPLRRGRRRVTFGYTSGDFCAADVGYADGTYSFTVVRGREKIARCRLAVRGKHNILNALAAIAAAAELGIEPSVSARAIEGFCGVKRRFEKVCDLASGAQVFCDYAHHPDEIAAAIDTARVMTRGRITAVFEPHTYSRTKSLMDEFSEAFFWADEVLILPTYAAREKPSDGASAYELWRRLRRRRSECLYLEGYREARDCILAHAHAGDTVLLLGAGSIGTELSELLKGQ